ncbi:MAG: Teichuronic acid biosynthesis protein TuaB [Verrucomicrobia bacterium ADurb.Bin006]|nr:MAG: Teichuronic acid biosynthesis protein TuaB [Verrucomicrobia bacterium ADurb.Bin006]
MAKGLRSAFAWSALEQFGQQAAQFGLGVLLARLLSPAEFGLTGMLAVFFAVSESFTQAGLGSAIIQRRELTEDETTSCFYLNIILGALMAGVLCAISPWVAAFYATPVLAPMLCVLSLQVVFGSFRIVQDALRARDLDFKTLAIINWTATIASGAVGVAMAWRGFGVWSLVTQAVLRVFVGTVVLWVLRPWRPRGRFRWACIGALWPFSSRLLAAALLDSIFRNVYPVVIGKAHSAADLGFYARAHQFADTPSYALSAVTSRVAFPYFSTLQDDRVLLKRRLRQLIRLTATLNFPLMTGIAAAAPALVTALVTEKWAGCVPLLQVMSFAGLLHPLHIYHLKVLTALGRSDLYLKLEVIKKLLTVMNVLLTVRYGVFAMVCGALVTSFISYWLNSFYTRRLADYSWLEQISDLMPMLAVAAVVGGVGLAASLLPCSSPHGMLALQGVAMTLAYAGLVVSLRRTWFADSMALLVQLPWCPRWLSAFMAS